MRLPAPLDLDALRAHSPSVSPVPEEIDRPFWSVMISTYNSDRYIRRTLESVLRQDPGPDEMQIEVVDGCSTRDDPEKIVQELGKGRVTFYRLPSNRGAAHTINVCVHRSRGRWVHNLQGDDMVLPGFYEAYKAVIQAYCQVLTVVGQVIIIDDYDRWMRIQGPTPPVGGGILVDFIEAQAWQQLVRCPSVVVRRDAYEKIGGFCTLFRSVTDWDMWFRLGQLAPIACVSYPYSLYRRHEETETNHLMESATHVRESYLVMKANLARLNRSVPIAEKAWRSEWAAKADGIAWSLDNQNSTEGRYNHARWAWMLEPTTRRLTILVKSWLKHRLKRKVLPAA